VHGAKGTERAAVDWGALEWDRSPLVGMPCLPETCRLGKARRAAQAIYLGFLPSASFSWPL